MTYDWFPCSGVLQMHLPEPSSDVDIRVKGNTYTSGSFNLIDDQQSTASLNATHAMYNAGDGLSLYFGTFANVTKSPNVRLGGQWYGPTQITDVVYDNNFSHNFCEEFSWPRCIVKYNNLVA